MIPRYSRPEMTAIWEPADPLSHLVRDRGARGHGLAELGIIPKEAAAVIWEKGKAAEFDVARIDEIERVTKHDVIAFLTHLAEHVGPEARFVHQGMTSSDVLDTCLNVQLVRAADLLLGDIDRLLAALQHARLRAQGHDHHRPQPRHPRRADDVRHQARLRHAEFQRAPRHACVAPARRSPPAPSPAPSARSPTSTRASKRTSPARWA